MFPLKTRPGLSFGYLLVPGLGLLFAALFAAQDFYRFAVLGSPTTWKDVFGSAIPRWVLYSILAPFVGWFVGRYPVESGRVRSRLALHAMAGTTFAVLHSVLIGSYFAVLRLYPSYETYPGAIRRLLLYYFGVNLVIYVAISGAWHALRYFREIRQREILASEMRRSLTEARLQALRAQLNPHFLFNTLHATSTLALTGQPDEVVRTLNRLGDLLRVSLDTDLPQEIPMEQELGILSLYLDIQRIRFGDRLSIEIEIGSEAREAIVPSMILQPLVENAFQHGISRCTGPGRVTIRAERLEARLRLRVEDSGPGFSANGSAPARNGIGLTNTKARLDQLYGDAARMAHGNAPGEGAFTEVWLPFRSRVEAS